MFRRKKGNDSEENVNLRYSNQQIEVFLDGKNSKAEKMLNNDKKMDKFLNRLERKLARIPKIGKRLADIPVIIALVKAYVKKEYRNIPVGSIIVAVSALIYFVSPADVIPDVIPFSGYIDDTAVLTYMAKILGDELSKFKEWRDY